MLEPNVQKLLSELQPTDQVLDVGGWACPFNRAQWILDAQPFETRGFYRTFGESRRRMATRNGSPRTHGSSGTCATGRPGRFPTSSSTS